MLALISDCQVWDRYLRSDNIKLGTESTFYTPFGACFNCTKKYEGQRQWPWEFKFKLFMLWFYSGLKEIL